MTTIIAVALIAAPILWAAWEVHHAPLDADLWPNPDRFTAADDLATVTNWHADFPEAVCGPLLAADLASVAMPDVLAAVEAMLKEAAQ